MKYKDLNDFFKTHLAHIKVDKKLAFEISRFRIKWLSKTPDHVAFLGGNLTGTNIVRYTKDDEEFFFVDILGVDQDELQKELYKVPGINRNFNVSSDINYQTFIWLIREFLHNSKLKKSDAEEAAMDVFRLFSYKALSSLLVRRFKFTLDEETALAVYEKLSNRFLIKKLGSWQAVIDYRAQDLISPKGLHAKALKRYRVKDAVEIANDVQGRYRKAMNAIFSVIVEVKEEGEKISLRSITQKDADGNNTIKDFSRTPGRLRETIIRLSTIPHDFIRDDIIHVTYQIVHTARRGDLDAILQYVTTTSDIDTRANINKLLEGIVSHSLEYLNTKGISDVTAEDIDLAINYLKGFWMASKIPNPEIRETRDLGNGLAYEVLKTTNKSRLSSARTAFFIYVIIRGLAEMR